MYGLKPVPFKLTHYLSLRKLDSARKTERGFGTVSDAFRTAV